MALAGATKDTRRGSELRGRGWHQKKKKKAACKGEVLFVCAYLTPRGSYSLPFLVAKQDIHSCLSLTLSSS